MGVGSTWVWELHGCGNYMDVGITWGGNYMGVGITWGWELHGVGITWGWELHGVGSDLILFWLLLCVISCLTGSNKYTHTSRRC